uniref:G-protein coupled receptors family 1 profile domain-containing protein n=1 Tax=Strigops habroptila TaxID=2489341 RepID=A0A672TKH7_STRHB
MADSNHHPRRLCGGPFAAALLAVFIGLMVLATVLGNALVIFAFVVDRSLRTQGNFFFLNLAIADLLVGEFRDAGRGRGQRPAALPASPPSSVRRGLLHPLRADGREETRQGLM